MGRGAEYLAMKIEGTSLMDGNLRELINATARVIGHMDMLERPSGLTTRLFQTLASVAAIYLLVLDRTNWRTKMLTALLVPYIFLSLPHGIFHTIRGELGKWIAFVIVVVRLFFHRHFPEWTEIPRAMILLVVVAPSFLADHMRESWSGMVVLLVIGCYLLQEHIRATGGFRNSLTRSHGLSNTLGLVLLLVYPIWGLLIIFMM